MALISKGLGLLILFPSALSFQAGSSSSINLRNTQHRVLHAATNVVEYGVDVPYGEASYDPHAAADFYKDRPIESISRLTQIVSKSSGFITDTILDTKLNREDKMVDRRSDELLELVSELGPTFIKSARRSVRELTCCQPSMPRD